MSERLVILGGDDPEMRAIHERCEQLGIEYAYAIDGSTGERVHCRVAYSAQIEQPGRILDAAEVVLVEAGLTEPFEEGRVISIDHHRPGDPGFDLPPSQGVEASSLGQMATLFGFELTDRERAMAAIDHSYANSIHGLVDGVDAQDARDLRVIEIAEQHGVSEEQIRFNVLWIGNSLRNEPTTRFNGERVVDMRHQNLGDASSVAKLCLQTAAIDLGVPIIIKHEDYPGGPEKIVLTGGATPEMVDYFIEDWGPDHGLENVYGVPSRGYAGGYLAEADEYQ